MSLQQGQDVKLELEQYYKDTREIEKGIDFILSHLEEPLIFPRKISTQKSQNKQFSVEKQTRHYQFLCRLKTCRL